MIRTFPLLFLSLLVATTTYATPRTTATEQAALAVARAEKRLARRYKSLTAEQKTTVLAYLKKRGSTLVDSDSDGLPDLIDGPDSSTSRCDSDSDDDGVLDGTEIEDGFSPTKPDSDDDGFPDSMEREAKGKVTAFTDPSVTVGTTTFTLGDTTVFKSITRAQLAVGSCVEIEGHVVDTSVIADKVSAENDCGGTTGGDDRGGRGGRGGDD